MDVGDEIDSSRDRVALFNSQYQLTLSTASIWLLKLPVLDILDVWLKTLYLANTE